MTTDAKDGRGENREGSGRPSAVILGTAIAVLALAAAVGSLANAFTGDDHWFIEWNSRVHQLSGAWRLFGQTYVPPEYGAANYRPLAMVAFAVEWAVGGGAPWVVHAAGVLLYVGVALAFWRLAAAVLPRGAAWVAAALFAVHPTHADVTANAVGQSELWAALWVMIGVTLYLRWRRDGEAWSLPRTAVLALVYAAACASKEHGFILPLLLVAAECIVVRDVRPWPARLVAAARPAAALMVTALAYLVVRWTVAGTLAGDSPSFVLAHVPPMTRVLTVWGAVPTVATLLLWPAHMVGEYTPQTLRVYRALDPGLVWPGALVAIAIALAMAARRRASAVTFGIVWIALTRLPASNLVVTSGVMLAPRILFLPTAGAMLAVGGVLAWLDARSDAVRRLFPRATPAARRALAGMVVGALLGLGIWRSESRLRAWRDDLTLVKQTVLDAPDGYFARYQFGRALFQLGRPAEGERELRLALALDADDPRPFIELADAYAHAGLCEPAVPLYRRALTLLPKRPDARSGLANCLWHERDYVGARSQARIGLAYGYDAPTFRALVLRADSALTVPVQRPGSVSRRPARASRQG